MKLSKAISYRITQLLSDKKLSPYRLSTRSAVPTSTVSNIILCHSKSCTLETLNNICRGFGISLEKFFASPLFSPENLDDN